MGKINPVPLALPTEERLTKRDGFAYYLRKFLKPDKAKVIVSLLIGITFSMVFWYFYSSGYCEGEKSIVCLVILFFVANYFLSLSMIMPENLQAIVLLLGAGISVYVYGCGLVSVYRSFKSKKSKPFKYFKSGYTSS